MTYKRHTNGGWIGPVKAKPGDIVSPGAWSLDDFRSRLRGTNDADYASVVLLVQFNGPPNTVILSANLPDYSTYAHGSTVAATVKFNGNFPKFTEAAPNVEANTAAAEFSNAITTNIQWLASGTEFTFGTGDFTVELWMYPTATSADAAVLEMRPNLTNGPHLALFIGSGGVAAYVNSANLILSGGGPLASNTYYHLAFSRVSGTSRLFLDGTQVGSSAVDATNYASTRVYLGDGAFGSTPYPGYIDSLRITKGVGRYSANFTAPTLPFPNFGPV